MFQAVLCADGRPVVERHLEEDELHGDHEAGLEEQGDAVVGAEPVEDSAKTFLSATQAVLRCRGLATQVVGLLEYRGNEHDERDVEGKAIAAFGSVDRDDLVGVGGDGREDQAGKDHQSANVWFRTNTIEDRSYNSGAR